MDNGENFPRSKRDEEVGGILPSFLTRELYKILRSTLFVIAIF